MHAPGTAIRRRRPLLSQDRGATLLEYAIVAAAIAAVIVLAVGLLGRSTNSNFACTQESWSTRTERC